MNEIIWSDLAYLTFTDIAEYLTKNVSIDAAIKFNDEVESLVEKLQSFSHLCKPDPRRPKLRECTVNKFTSMTYRVDGNKIHIITFFDNRGLHPF